jgi:hypothetical protein
MQSAGAIKAMGTSARLERQRNQAATQIEAAKDARRSSTYGSAAGSAISLAPKVKAAYDSYQAGHAALNGANTMESAAGTSAMQTATGATEAGGSVLADGTIASSEAVMAAAPEAAAEVAATAGTEAAATAATEAAATASAEALAAGATEAAATAAATTATTAGTTAMAAIPVVGWIGAAASAVYSLGSAFDWW